jgi:hypothetical protein
MRRDLLTKSYDGDASRAGVGVNPGASTRNRYAAKHDVYGI